MHCISCKEKIDTLSTIRSFRRFCEQLSDSSPCLPGQQGSCITIVELSENILQNLGNDLMADNVDEYLSIPKVVNYTHVVPDFEDIDDVKAKGHIHSLP